MNRQFWEKLLIFDMDGVLLNSEPLHQKARDIMFEKYGVVPDGTLPDPVGLSTGGYWELIGKKYGMEVDPGARESEHFDLVAMLVEREGTPPSAGLVELLERARAQGVKIGLASSSAQKLVRRVLELFQIRKYFDLVVCGEEIKHKKPAPDIYNRVLELSGLSPSQAAAVEDSTAGVRAAKSAGLFCYGYRNPTSGSQNLSEADRIIDSLSEI